jgi:hypothetical protein
VPSDSIVLAIDHPNFCAMVERALRNRGLDVTRLTRARELVDCDLEGTLVFLDTNDDIALLFEIVDELYLRLGVETALPIVAVASKEEFGRNRRLASWCVGGHAAVIAVVPVTARDESMLAFVYRMLDAVKTADESTSPSAQATQQ